MGGGGQLFCCFGPRSHSEAEARVSWAMPTCIVPAFVYIYRGWGFLKVEKILAMNCVVISWLPSKGLLILARRTPNRGLAVS